MSKMSSDILADYLRWRDVIFSVSIDQVDKATGEPDQVYGVVMDVGLSDEFVISITAFPTGESSLRTTVGGGVTGLGNDQTIAGHAAQIVHLAQSLVDETKPASDHSLPGAQMVFFYFLTTSGLRSYTTPIKEVDSQDQHHFHEIFNRFTAIKVRSEELTKASRK